MACLASRESHAARACRQGRKRSRARKLKYPDVSFSRCSRAERMGRRTRKSVAALAGRLPACDPARPRSAGAGFGSEGRRRAAWNRARAPKALRAWDTARRQLQGRSRGLVSVTSQRGRGALLSRDASAGIRTASPAPLAADMRTGSLAARRLTARNGYGAAQHVRRKKEDSR